MRLHIDAQDEYVLRIARRDQPVAAVIELVWNALDAEAHNVNVILERNDLGGIDVVRVEDDGHGVEPEMMQSAFQRLGGSWKAEARVSPNIKRPMNGRNGQGRIRGFALGHQISWTTVAKDTTGKLCRLEVVGNSNDPTNFEGEHLKLIEGDGVGTLFTATNPPEFINRLLGDTARPRVTSTFAVFLTENPRVTITFDGKKLDPTTAERSREEVQLPAFISNGQTPRLRIIEWSNDPGRAIHLCDTSGSVLSTISPDIHTPGFNYTAYLLWDEFGKRSEEALLAELEGGVVGDLIQAAREEIKLYYRRRDSQRRKEQIAEWVKAGDYPYAGEPASEVERVERESFDYVATSVARKLPRTSFGRRSTLALLRVALSSEPSSIPRIIDGVMPLTKREQEDLARLLDRTSMSQLIEANKKLTSRLDFIAALRSMVFDPQGRKLTKERKELHKILARETWLFGDEYDLLTSDKGLTEVLVRHINALRPGQNTQSLVGTVRRGDGSRGIVDLMLSRQRRTVNRREHLVVELKRPNVPITQKEMGQLRSYADAVADDPQFESVDVHWDFWIISTEMDSSVKRDANQPNQPPGLVTTWNNIRIWAKTWSQLVEENEFKLRYFKESLEYDASKEHAIDYINRSHDPAAIPKHLHSVS